MGPSKAKDNLTYGPEKVKGFSGVLDFIFKPKLGPPPRWRGVSVALGLSPPPKAVSRWILVDLDRFQGLEAHITKMYRKIEFIINIEGSTV
jgi:hypothetical protein